MSLRDEIAKIIDPLPFDDGPAGWIGMPETRRVRQVAALAKADIVLDLLDERGGQ